MKNITKIRSWLSLVLALALCTCRPAPSPYASYGGEPLTPLRPDSVLFTSADGRIFLRLPYCIPPEDTSHDPSYVFFDTLQCDYFNYIKTSEWLDVPTFRRVPGTANYWIDKRAIYTGPNSRPGQLYFFELACWGRYALLPTPIRPLSAAGAGTGAYPCNGGQARLLELQRLAQAAT